MDLDMLQITQQRGLEIPDSEKNLVSYSANITLKGESADARNYNSASVPEQARELEMGTSPTVREQDEVSPIIIPATSMCKQQFQCRICMAVFSKQWNCVSHMRAHRRVRPVFHCPTCGKKCSKQSELDIHVRIHTGEKPFSCSICQRRFTRQGQLNSHMRCHTGIKPYLCYDCGASFASVSNLKRHQHLHAKDGRKNLLKKPNMVDNDLVENEIVSEGQKLETLTNGCLSSVEVSNSVSHLPLVKIYEIQSSISNCNTEPSESPAFHASNGNINTPASSTRVAGNGNINTPASNLSVLCEQSKRCQSEHVHQLICQPIKAIPAMVPSQQVFILHPDTGDPLEEKVVKISEVFSSRGDNEDTATAAIEPVQSDPLGNNSQDSEMAVAWLERITQENGHLCLTDNITSVPSSEALPNIMQVDLSFLLEDTGLPMQDQCSDETTTEPLTDQLSQSLLPSNISVIGCTAYQTNDSDTATQPVIYQHSNTLQAENDSPSIQLNVPGMVEDSVTVPNVPGMVEDSVTLPHVPGMVEDSVTVSNVPGMVEDSVTVPNVPGMVEDSVTVSNVSGMVEDSVTVSNVPGMVDGAVTVPNVPGMVDGAVTVPNVPGMVEDSVTAPLSGSILAQNEDTSASELMSAPTVPTVVPIPHLPVISFNSLGQDTGQMMAMNQIATQVKPESGSILVVVDPFYGAQQLQTLIADPATTKDSKAIPLSVDNASLPIQQAPVIRLPQPMASLVSHGHDYSAAQTHRAPVPVKRQQVKSLSCDMCPRRFARQWYLTVHRNTHFREKTFTCDICSAKFSRMGNLNRHKQMHIGAKPFQCGQCQSRFATKYRLAEHERRHEGLKPYMCEICHRHFTDCSSLRRHQRAHRGDNLQYTCDICGASFRTMHSLTSHFKLHAEDEGSECVEQGVTLDEGELTPADVPIVPFDPSQTRETAKKIPCVLKSADAKGHSVYLCSVCRKSFLFSAACRQHIFCHTGCRPYKCADCGAGFSRKACAKRHTHVHRREKRHQCQKCGVKFQTKPRLILHSDDHLPPDMLTISCDECDKKFSEERLLVFHKKIFHRQQLSLYKPGVGFVERHSVRKKKRDLRIHQHGENGSETDSTNVDHPTTDDKTWCQNIRKKTDRLTVYQRRKRRPARHKIRQGPGEPRESKRKLAAQKKTQLLCNQTEEGYDTNYVPKQASLKAEEDKGCDTKDLCKQASMKAEEDKDTNQISVTIQLEKRSVRYQTENAACTSESHPSNSTLQSIDQNSVTRPRRAAALNQREFLASLQLKRKTRR